MVSVLWSRTSKEVGNDLLGSILRNLHRADVFADGAIYCHGARQSGPEDRRRGEMVLPLIERKLVALPFAGKQG
jgi:hypothetical protein